MPASQYWPIRLSHSLNCNPESCDTVSGRRVFSGVQPICTADPLYCKYQTKILKYILFPITSASFMKINITKVMKIVFQTFEPSS